MNNISFHSARTQTSLRSDRLSCKEHIRFAISLQILLPKLDRAPGIELEDFRRKLGSLPAAAGHAADPADQSSLSASESGRTGS